jgi:two-component system, OmpR family, phosphate regulon sensor histidine kinase PhoR
MPKSPRLRILFLLCGIAAAALAAAVAYSVGPTAVEATLVGSLPKEQIEAAAAALRSAILAAFLASLLLVIPVSLWIGGFAQRPIERLRAALGRGRPRRRSGWGVAEVDALAAAFTRLIEEHDRAITLLRQERDDLAFLIDSVGEGILQIDEDGRFVRVNRMAREMIALPDSVARQPVSTLVRNAELRGMLHAARSGETPEPLELNLDGRRILVVGRPLRDETGRLGAVIVLVDLTDLRRLEGVRRDFVANASHELKTPLTSIRGYVETLLGDEELPDTMRRQFLETIRRNTNRLQAIVDDLLDLTRLESGGWRPDLQAVDIAEIAAEVWKGLADRGEEKGIAFAVVNGGESAAWADPIAVRQILVNLLDNAIRYTAPNGRITVRIGSGTPRSGAGHVGGPGVSLAKPPAAHAVLLTGRRGASSSGKGIVESAHGSGDTDARRWIITEVVDTGTGIPRDALPRVFERFYRVDPARSRVEGGTGLGLAIVKHLVQSMGGDVAVESELGRGTTFQFWLQAPAAVPAGGSTPADAKASA